MLKLHPLSADETVLFATDELRCCLQRLWPDGCVQVVCGAQAGEGEILLGLPGDIPESTIDPHPLDDAFEIRVENSAGFLCGSNPRSVLFAVYRFLGHLGMRWPSPDKEILPAADGLPAENAVCLTTREAAGLRHRGIIMEGANSLENVLSLVNWLPKLFYNSYFIQFKTPYTFFASWYQHVNNPLLAEQPFSQEDARRCGAAVEAALKLRGLEYHAVGHAWTCEAVGLDGLGWTPQEQPTDAAILNRLAMVDGKRQLFGGIPINTNLCYAQQENMDALCDGILSYAKAHRNISVLHVWLADEFNNSCECEKCRDVLPSDQYIRLLNRVDEALAREGLSTRICILIYSDLLWAPQKETLNNPERFILVFAPIGRTYESSYADVTCVPEPPKYVRNRNKMPVRIEENLAFLQMWQKKFQADGFIFDCPLGRAHYGDPGYEKIALVINRDVKCIRRLGLNGYMSCQQQRSFFPTGLPNYVMAKTLWDVSADFEEIAKEYYEAAFGGGCVTEKARGILQRLSAAFDTDYWNGKLDPVQPEIARRLAGVDALADDLDALCREALLQKGLQPSQRSAWQQLSCLPQYVRLFAAALGAKASGRSSRAEYRRFAEYLQQKELELQPVLDVYRLLRLCNEYLKLNDD